MGLDDLIDNSDVSASGSSSGGNSSTRKTDISSDRYQWVTKIDFGTPYILVARAADGSVYCDRDEIGFAVWEDRLDWRRLDDHPQKDLEVVYSVPNRRKWLRFCDRAKDQLNEDPEQLFEEKPDQLAELRERVHFPNPSPPSSTRTCRICEASSDDKDTVILELDLQKHRKIPVCESHTIEDLAHNGLLE